MVIRKNADETEFEVVLEGRKSLEEIEYDIQESPYSLFTDHPIMIDPARNIHYLVPPKDPVWPKQLWAKLNRMIEDSRPITEEDYALYRRRIEWCEWVSNCPLMSYIYTDHYFFERVSFFDRIPFQYIPIPDMPRKYSCQFRDLLESDIDWFFF